MPGALALSLGSTGCGREVMLFSPAGPVAAVEHRLIITSIVLVLIVIVPVIIMLWVIVSKYRDKPGNNARYDPEWSESKWLEMVWWGVPIVIIGVLGTITARDTFRLTAPPVPVSQPLTVQVTSLDWKWLFQYPDEKIATVNYCEIPANRPVQFVLTSNAPMNSFWVPRLGGQEYTMPGMAMRLWLQADHPGVYYGHGANFSGRGFAHMQFHVKAVPQAQYAAWAQKVKRTAPPLTSAGYNQLVTPKVVVDELSFSSYPAGSFEAIVNKEGGMYMKHDRTVLQGMH
ncbi:cytochrome c oxidase subunit II [Alicyclobacillus sp. ALC3]|nr:cytochrome c oxidase subunit II [Alicyclobacillus sp. ALC3]